MGVTIKDVAKRAGVSHTTVSKVIHNSKKITEETRARVLKAIEEIKYYPNYSARSLIRGKTNSIAVVAPYFYFSSLFEIYTFHGIEKFNLDHDNKYVIQQFTTGHSIERRNELLQDLLFGKRADAVIAIGFAPEPKMIEAFTDMNVPLVLVDAKAKGAHTVKADNFKGSFLATEHLIATGRKKILFTCAKLEHDMAVIASRERFDGFKAALEKHGIPFNQKNMIEVIEQSFDDGKMILNKIVNEKLDVDAVFSAAGDMVALGILSEANIKKIKIPGDLAVVGYDDIIISSMVTPPLTTVRQPAFEMGIESLKIAFDAMEGKSKEIKFEVFEPKLVIRESA